MTQVYITKYDKLNDLMKQYSATAETLRNYEANTYEWSETLAKLGMSASEISSYLRDNKLSIISEVSSKSRYGVTCRSGSDEGAVHDPRKLETVSYLTRELELKGTPTSGSISNHFEDAIVKSLTGCMLKGGVFDLSVFIQPMSNRSFIRICRENGISHDIHGDDLEYQIGRVMERISGLENFLSLYNEAILEIKEENLKLATNVNFNVKGLSAYNPKMLWLFAKGKIEKLKSTIYTKLNSSTCEAFHFTDNGNKLYYFDVISFRDNISTTNHEAVSCRGYSQLFPRNWLLSGVTRLVYPKWYAEKFNIPVSTKIEGVYSVCGRYSDMTFSRSCGYYNSNTHKVIDSGLCHVSNIVTLSTGQVVNKVSAVLVTRHNQWRHINDCCLLGDVYEIRDECRIIDDLGMVHKSDPRIVQCLSCGTYVASDSMKTMSSKKTDHVFKFCSECHSKSERYLLKMCYSTDVVKVHGYGSTPLKIGNEPVFVGYELETYADFASNKDYLLEINGYLNGGQTYCVGTSDGSLDDHHGIEYIFKPEGLNAQKRNTKDFCSSVGRYLRKDAGNGYGLHVHVSSHFLSGVDKLKISNFVSMFEKYFRSIGGRNETEYQRKKESLCKGNNKALTQHDTNRYSMVNINPDHTIEYRFPKSLVDEVHISLNLEMAQAVTLFGKYHLSVLHLDTKKPTYKALEAFIKYVDENKATYPLLYAENNANIQLNNLGKYSIMMRSKPKSTLGMVVDAVSDVYALCA